MRRGLSHWAPEASTWPFEEDRQYGHISGESACCDGAIEGRV